MYALPAVMIQDHKQELIVLMVICMHFYDFIVSDCICSYFFVFFGGCVCVCLWENVRISVRVCVSVWSCSTETGHWHKDRAEAVNSVTLPDVFLPNQLK